MRQLLRDLGLESFVKTSGGKGLHLYVPLNTRVTFDRAKDVSRALAAVLERDDPARVTTMMRRDLRPGRVFIDWSQNDAHKTTACAYTLRALSRPSVSVPLDWTEVEDARTERHARHLAFDPAGALRRVEEHGDLFAPVLSLKQHLPAVKKSPAVSRRGR
jgi:bifunctional non-homologous end joining protein LigD